MSSIRHRLETRIAEGVLIEDPEQIQAADALDSRLQALSEYNPDAGSGLVARFLGGRTCVPRGLYMYGGVGRGKSMLMDWFYDCLLYTSPSPRDRTRSRMPSSA